MSKVNRLYLGEISIQVSKEENDVFIGRDLLSRFLEKGLVIDGRLGGLVLGNYHDDHGILIVRITNKGRALIANKMEGFECLFSSKATSINLEKLKRINNEEYADDSEMSCELDGISVLDARPIKISGSMVSKLIAIYFGDQFVMNKKSSLMNLEKLDNLNKK
jgi:hypothetical protein